MRVGLAFSFPFVFNVLWQKHQENAFEQDPGPPIFPLPNQMHSASVFHELKMHLQEESLARGLCWLFSQAAATRLRVAGSPISSTFLTVPTGPRARSLAAPVWGRQTSLSTGCLGSLILAGRDHVGFVENQGGRAECPAWGR